MRAWVSAVAFALGLLPALVLIAGDASAQGCPTGQASVGGTQNIYCARSSGTENIVLNLDTITFTSTTTTFPVRAIRDGGNGDITVNFAGSTLRSTGEEDAYGIEASVGRDATGDSTVTIRGGSIETTAGAHAVNIVASGTGNARLTMSGGSVTAGGTGPTGTGASAFILKRAAQTGTVGNMYVTISGGTITTSGGPQAFGVFAGQADQGHTEISVSGGTIRTETQLSSGVRAVQSEQYTGDISIELSGNGRIITTGRSAPGIEFERNADSGNSANPVGDGANIVRMLGGSIETSGRGSHGISMAVRTEAATTGSSITVSGGFIHAKDEDGTSHGIQSLYSADAARGDIRVEVTGDAVVTAGLRGNGVVANYIASATARQGNGAIEVTVGEGATVVGGLTGIVVNGGKTGLALEKRYTPPAVQEDNPDKGPDDLIPFADHPAHIVRVDGTVRTVGAVAGVSVNGGAVIVGRNGVIDSPGAGISGPLRIAGRRAVPVIVHIDGRVTGRSPHFRYGLPERRRQRRDRPGRPGGVRRGAPAIWVNSNDYYANPPTTPTLILGVVGEPRVEGGITQEAADAAAGRIDGLIRGNAFGTVPGATNFGTFVAGISNFEAREGAVVLAVTDDDGYTGHTVSTGLVDGGASTIEIPKGLPPAPRDNEEEEEEGGCPSPGCVRFAEPEQPGPTQPEPEQPGPTQPEPEQPGPTQPEPEPGPTQPEPEQPGPTQPEPEQPGPTQPEPEQPGPTQPEPTPTPTEFNCDMTSDKRCRLYEALPSALLAMNGLPSRAERMSAVRDARGGWLRVEAAGGKWTADGSTRPDVAYDFRRHGMRAGMDFAMGETGLVGVSVHGLRGSAEMTRGGKFEVSGEGLGVNASVTAGDIHVDIQAAATRYEAELTSSQGTVLKDGAKGRGFALGVEAGRSVAMGGGASLTPRLGLEWSRVSLEDFRDTRLATVSMDDARSMRGRVGLTAETALGPDAASGRVYGSVDVEREFQRGTSVTVEDDLLETTGRSTGLRLGVGGSLGMGDGVVLRGGADWMTGGGGTNGFGGRLELNVRF